MKSLTMSRGISIDKAIGHYPISFNKDGDLFLPKSILRSLLIDIDRLRPGTKGLGRDLITLEARLEKEGVSFLATNLCTLGKALEKGLNDGIFVCPKGFKRPKGSKNPALMQGIFNDLFDSSTGLLVKDRDCVEDVYLLRQLLFFLEEVRSRNGFGRKAKDESDTNLYPVRSSDSRHCPVSRRAHWAYLSLTSQES